MKQSIFVIDTSLDNGTEYTLEELEALAQKHMTDARVWYPHNPNIVLINSFKIMADNEWDYGDSYTRFVIKFYRLETDEEYNTRLDRELRQKQALETANNKRKLTAEAKKQKQAELEQDPEYQKFIELKKKFQ